MRPAVLRFVRTVLTAKRKNWRASAKNYRMSGAKNFSIFTCKNRVHGYFIVEKKNAKIPEAERIESSFRSCVSGLYYYSLSIIYNNIKNKKCQLAAP